ncbi:cationic amino acid transporter-like [Raphidocelis subcapitata]|uniref:Cationic amino acid transporter-like n=1 Tax=Raphidocelis subcapitata TaxID=307507 RepID=A0A2V0NQC7_9CHLO|nr:cationic amino acid transporter-like [Raphidocelis subcapitata]|eukprot:GBF87743.1 cationic amino acid transporter-like [Raphidocelis subcapitata]
MGGFKTWGFESFEEYTTSLKTAWRSIRNRAFEPTHAAEEVEDNKLPRTLNWFHISCLGVGLILGAGIFVSTGEAANQIAGPAVILSFAVAGLSAILSTLCYSEFAVRFPLSGGAFNYLLFSCGELVAFCCVTSLILEYVLANAAVARSFSPYLGQLIGKGSEFFVFQINSDLVIDPLGAGLVAVCVALVMVSTEHSNKTNLIITVVHVAVVVMIMIVGESPLGFTKANPRNLRPFIPTRFGVRGIFEGASFVFFSFIGFDCVSTMAEEVVNPARDMPVGIVSCILLVTIIYILMALSLVMMVPFRKIDPRAAFAAAFEVAGMPWMRVVVALGALLGIVTGVLVGMMAVARIFSAVGRSHLVFPVIGHVHPKYRTPAVSTLILGIPTILLALLSDLPMLVNLVSAGTLFVFGAVAVALIIKRYTLPPKEAEEVSPRHKIARTALITLLVCSASGLGIAYNLDKRFWVYIIVICIHLALTMAPKPDYTSPLFPYVPSASLLINAWLCSTLPASAWTQYAIFLAIMCAVYFLYSCASSLALEEHSALRHGPKTSAIPPEDLVRVISETASRRDLVELSPDGGEVPIERGASAVSRRAPSGTARRGGSATRAGDDDPNALKGAKAVELV